MKQSPAWSAARPAIVLVAFGTSVERAHAVYDDVIRQVRRRWPGHDVCWAFTSAKVRCLLERAGVRVPSPEQVIHELVRAGHRCAVIQPFYVTAGAELEQLRRLDCSPLDVVFGAPLLASQTALDRTACALVGELQPRATNILVMHGNEKHPELNRPLAELAASVRRLAKEQHAGALFAATLEGPPGIEPLKQARRHAVQTGWAHFVPVLFAAGKHVSFDVMGDHADSWKTRVAARRTTCALPLACNRAVLEVYYDHLDNALEELASRAKGCCFRRLG